MRKRKKPRPRLFVGSSQESIDLAYAIHKNLDDDAEVTVWKQGVFELAGTAVDSLQKVLKRSDFGVFVFAPNDALRLRQTKYAAVRDNVVFELGLFMGHLGRARTYVVTPKSRERLRIPTDLAGVTVGSYDAKRRDGNLEAAVGPFCSDVRKQIKKLGSKTPKTSRAKKPAKRKLGKNDLVVLEALYGARDHRENVTAVLNSLIKNNKLHVYVGNQLAKSDPCPNTPKNLRVRYRFNGVEESVTVRETEDLTLPKSAT